MVPTTSTALSEEQKRPPRKKPLVTGIWPCKINGCNKQFAREADLKRHQRTTKTHSMPSFPCPQCDANFTRTDALRRHQKSRHDGVVIEPVSRNKGGDENADGRSRSGTPSSKGKEREFYSNIPVQTHQGAPTHAGPSSYYRSHTVTISPHIPKPPISSKTGPPWPEYPTWQNGVLPPTMGPTGYISYYPSPHYRPHTSGYHTGPTSAYQSQVPPPHSSSSSSTSRNSSIPSNSSPSHTSASLSQSPPTISSDYMSPSDPTDPNFELEEQTELTEADVVAAVQAVLMQAESEEAAKKQRLKELEERERLIGGGIRSESAHSDRASMSSPLSFAGLEAGLLHRYTRPEPMEHILTEDGEPMLNPAELLTQESLASPPPS
ncbi:hypothetical protein CPB84DRAFT_1309415 [Gymnopilus junonius]|uniref:C2H2-type domain-containing protein n=1 Tax=Gymnopilus junonius TaxID=109634 RepID=A0A9P5TLW2_GYMJU|nr:hypothetical protein CPB84DRAFT_1309415 [Gymnopilus junonius]